MPAPRGRKSNLKTDDMDRWRVEFRLTLDREHRRFHKANDVDFFEELLKAKLSDKSQEQQQSEGLSLNLTRLDDSAFSKLTSFLRTFMSQCPSSKELDNLHKVVRDLLIELKQDLHKKSGYKIDPYCLFCGTSIQQARQQQDQQRPIANHQCDYQQLQNNYTPNVTNGVSTPPPSAAPTPDGLLNHSLQRLQSQFSTSFTRQSSGGDRSATPPMSANAMATLRLRQNQEAQRALDEARNETSQANASPMGLVNFNQQPNNDDDDDDDERSEVASVRETISHVNRILSSPVRGRQRSSSSPLSSSDSSSDLVMDVSADASASQTTEPDTPTFKKIKTMREELKRPTGGFRIKKGGPKRNDSQRISQPTNSRR